MTKNKNSKSKTLEVGRSPMIVIGFEKNIMHECFNIFIRLRANREFSIVYADELPYNAKDKKKLIFEIIDDAKNRIWELYKEKVK